jgi:hypothetical protein
MRRGAKNSHEPLRTGVGKRAEEIGVEHAEHRRVRADAERERERRDSREAFMLEQHAQAITQVLKHFILQSWQCGNAELSSQRKISRYFHFPFSNCHFSFVIAGAAADTQ